MTAQTLSPRWAMALLLLTPALWSVNYLVARLAPGEIAPHMLALGRWMLAATVLGAFAFSVATTCPRTPCTPRETASTPAGWAAGG
jgi:hypothetical protein